MINVDRWKKVMAQCPTGKWTNNAIEELLDEIISLQGADKRDINVITEDIRQWSDATFPNRGVLSNGWHNPFPTLAHLVDPDEGEIKELIQALTSHDPEEVQKELADCLILLLQICSLVEVDPYEAITQKLEINKSRKWGEPDAQGIVHHVKDKC